MGELQRMGMRPGTLRERYGSWFEFVAGAGDLTPAEAEALPALRDFLRDVEITAMTKSFKMVTLAVLAETGDPFSGLPFGELAVRCHAWLRRRPDLWRDVPPDQQGELTSDGGRERWLAYWRRNPIEALTKGNKPPLCREESGHLKIHCPPAPLEITCSMLLEITDWRLAAYVDRTAPVTSDNGFRCKLIQANGRPIAKLPDRKRHSIPEG